MLTVENRNLDNLPDQQRLGTVSVRIMVHKWPLASSSDLQLIVIQEEVTEIDGKQVKKPPTFCLGLIYERQVVTKDSKVYTRLVGD